MKNLTLIILITLHFSLITLHLYTQPRLNDSVGLACLPEGIFFTAQEQIDFFQINYPNCAEIEGNVTISGNDITNLDGLNVLISIGGNLEIGDDNWPIYNGLTNLTGLDNVTYIGGNFYIHNNYALTSLSGLDNLTSIGGSLLIGSESNGINPALTSLTGLENLTSIGGELLITGCHLLTDLTALNNLNSFEGNIWIVSNSSLSTCDSDWLCDYITNPSGSINIGGNATGCNSVIDVAYACGDIPCLPYGNYYFCSQADIDNFQMVFPNCTELQGEVTIAGSDIINLSGLDNVTSIGSYLSIHHNDALTSMTGLETLTSIGSFLSIYNNNALTSLTGLEGLTSIGSDLRIRDNPALTTCDEEWLCDHFANLSGYIDINNNANGCNSVIDVAYACGGVPCLPYGKYSFYSQSDIDNFMMAFPNCSELLGNVTISGSTITNLSGLGSVTSFGGKLRIESNYALTSLTGLDNTTSIGGSLEIDNNYMTSLTGLEGLTSIGGNLWINHNNNLTCLTGLDSIAAGSIESLQILYNPILQTCEVKSICDYLAAPNGAIYIHDNAPGCNSQQEVEDACWTLVDDRSYINKLHIYPNPFSSKITIEFELKQAETITISIYNHIGVEVEVITESKTTCQQKIYWDSERLTAGIYFCTLKTNEGIQTTKIIKL